MQPQNQIDPNEPLTPQPLPGQVEIARGEARTSAAAELLLQADVEDLQARKRVRSKK